MTERLTRQQYMEKHKIKELPDKIVGKVINKTEAPDSPFFRIQLDSGFSVLFPTYSETSLEKDDKLFISKDKEVQNSKQVLVFRKSKRVKGTYVLETQVIYDDNWDRQSATLIEESRDSRWEWWRKYKKSKEDPDWFEKLKKNVSNEVLFRGEDSLDKELIYFKQNRDMLTKK